MKISVAMLAKDASAIIGDALESVDWADEVVVGIDSRTSDDTAEVVGKFGNARIVSASLAEGFGVAKNALIDEARNDWVLVMDTDERVTPELRQAIISADFGARQAYRVNRLNYMLGRAMRHGGWWPDYPVRLINRHHAHYSSKPVHEEMQVDGNVGTISEYFIHLTHPTVASIMERVERCAPYEAELIVAEFAESGKRVGVKELLWPATKRFVGKMVVKRAWKDGIPGLIELVCMSFYAFYNYAKAWELQRQKDL